VTAAKRNVLMLLIPLVGAFGLSACAGQAPGADRGAKGISPAPAVPGEGPVVIDPGHGGEDTGAVAAGSSESHLVLAVALKLRKALAAQAPGLPVVLTRESDVFVPLKGRMEMANRVGARLFISIHANSGQRLAARGFETYLLSAEATDSEAHRVALAENSVLEREGMAAQDPLFETLLSLASAEQLRQSEELAGAVHLSLAQSLGTENRGVKQAPFYVLARAQMPSVLVEIGFITNKAERDLLFADAYQEKLAQALATSILEFNSRHAAHPQAGDKSRP